MTPLFDTYECTYGDTVQSSIDFSGLDHSFFVAAKADLIGALVADHFASRSRLAALDIGCGIGSLHAHLRDIFHQINGLDVSPACIERAKVANPSVCYEAYDGTRFPFDAPAFDVALAVNVMHHVPPAQWPEFIREMRRVTLPGGLVLIIEHHPFNPLPRLAVMRCAFDRDAVLLRAGTTGQLFADAGLRDIATRYFLLLPSKAPLARTIEHYLARLPLGAQYAICGRV
jgi:SAM-dependent methyltransferase